MKKRDIVKQLTEANPGLLACPVCAEPMGMGQGYTLACANRHSFDVASTGYVNLLAKPGPSGYGAEMLESRLKVCRSGFFDTLLAEVAKTVAHWANGKRRAPTMLDAGCGEGSQLLRLTDSLRKSGMPEITGIGVDISKDGIRIAAREYPGFLWLVADLARLPVAAGSLDVVLNMLSPSNYGEFDRVLKEDGLLVKVAPGEDYLKELRREFYAGGDKERYSNERVVCLFESSYHLLETKRIRQSFAVPEGLWPHIVAMTPLTWGAGEAERMKFLENSQGSVTLDFTLLAGKKKG